MRSRAIPLSLLLPLALACGSTPANNEAGVGTDVADETVGESAEGSGESGEANDYAHGVAIQGITFNQGTSVALASGTDWVGPADRNARILRDRPALLRVFLGTDPGAVGREVECRLTLDHEDGTQEVLSTNFTLLEGSSGLQDPTTTCNFELEAESVRVGTSFQVSLHELEGSDGAGLPEWATVSPLEPALLGVEGPERYMKVRVFPCTFEGNTPPVMPEFQEHIDALYEQLPAQFVDVEMQDAIEVANPELSYILIVMGTQRANDGEPPDIYYYGWSVNTDNGGAGGLAMFGSFVAAGAWIGGSLYRRQTFVHELGHDQAMNHVECMTGAVEQMPPFADDYINDVGTIDWPGWGLLSKTMHDGFFTYNYMSYCDLGGQTWANGWNWGKSWDRMNYVAENANIVTPRPPVLRGIVGDDGVEGFWTTRARIDSERISGNHIFRFTSYDGEVIERPGEWVPAGEGASYQLTVELPEGFDLDTGTISRVSYGTEHIVALPKAMRIHEKFQTDIYATPPNN